MIKENDTIHLKGKTQKGKNRVREQGSTWMVLFIRDSVLFSSLPGPWLMVASLSSSKAHIRWVHIKNDVDFEIEEDK